DILEGCLEPALDSPVQRFQQFPCASTAAGNQPPTAAAAFGKHVAAAVIIKITEPEVLFSLGRGVKKGPVKFTGARIPPRRAGGEEQIIDTVPVKVAHAIFAERIRFG